MVNMVKRSRWYIHWACNKLFRMLFSVVVVVVDDVFYYYFKNIFVLFTHLDLFIGFGLFALFDTRHYTSRGFQHYMYLAMDVASILINCNENFPSIPPPSSFQFFVSQTLFFLLSHIVSPFLPPPIQYLYQPHLILLKTLSALWILIYLLESSRCFH